MRFPCSRSGGGGPCQWVRPEVAGPMTGSAWWWGPFSSRGMKGKQWAAQAPPPPPFRPCPPPGPRAREVSHPSLKDALLRHREETETQRERLLAILQKHGAKPDVHVDQGMQALLDETSKMLGMVEGDDLRDAGLIASAQRLAHYQIAAY